MVDHGHSIDISSGCVTGPRKRHLSFSPGTYLHSVKRPRLSFPYLDPSLHDHVEIASEWGPENNADRFIPVRPKHVPLSISPRTNRLATSFGLVDDRIFKFSDADTPSQSGIYAMLRESASQLLKKPVKTYSPSAAFHLGKQQKFVLCLDGPGIVDHPYSHPLSWSSTNCIAIACLRNVYYQNLNTRTVSHLCQLRDHDIIHCIEWGGESQPNAMAVGTSQGVVQVWDATRSNASKETCSWRDCQKQVGSMGWHDNVLAVGRRRGVLTLYDIRTRDEVKLLIGHKQMLHSVKWNHDGTFLASSDGAGIVCIWDTRACKSLLDDVPMRLRLRHQARVKALAWCPWKPDLLASGSVLPEGRINIWSTKKTLLGCDRSKASEPMKELHSISLTTSVTSLHWSPHCKELLSTHGRAGRTFNGEELAYPPSVVPNSIVVHSYPALKRIVHVNAHSAAITDSCLSPDGTHVFTSSDDGQGIRMWNVWGKRETQKKESIFDQYIIR